MKQVLTFEQKQKLITRAVSGYTSANGDVYIDALEDALIKSLLKGTEQRRELRRLNQSVRHINALEAQVREQESDISTLEGLLDREDNEDSSVADTDPAPSPEISAMEEAYKEWDFRTRYPNLAPRKVG